MWWSVNTLCADPMPGTDRLRPGFFSWWLGPPLFLAILLLGLPPAGALRAQSTDPSPESTIGLDEADAVAPAVQPLPSWLESVNVGYDRGFVIASDRSLGLSTEESPFVLRVNGLGQLRYTRLDSQGENQDLNHRVPTCLAQT